MWETLPARDIHAEVVVELVKNGGDPALDYTWDHDASTTGLLLKNEPIEVTGHRYVHQRSTNATDRPFTHDELVDYEAGKSYIAVYARVRYADIFGVRHWAKRCAWAFAKTTDGSIRFFTAYKCTSYSDIDKN